MPTNINYRVLGIYFKKEAAEKIEGDARKCKRTVSNFLRIIIEKHYEQKEDLAEVK